MPENPDWTFDELILALDLYMQCGRKQPPASDMEIVNLSNILNRLPIHDRDNRNEEFRNPNGVSMKLGNFLRLDPMYPGRGLSRGGKRDEIVWDMFANDIDRLHKLASLIRDSVSWDAQTLGVNSASQEEEEFLEGRIVIRLHTQKERKQIVVKKKKAQVLEDTGRLACEVCGFDFLEFYGLLGEGFAECHHLVPVSQLEENSPTTILDLAILCANCHRMIHKKSPMLTVDELRRIVNDNDGFLTN